MNLKPEDAYTSELQTVLRIAHALKEATAISCPPPLIAGDSSVAINSIRLPSLQPLLPSLLSLGITSEVASAASQIYERRAEELKHYIQESIAAAYRKAIESPALAHASPPDLLMKKVTSILTDVYFHRLEDWKEEIVQRIKQVSKLPQKAIPKSSRTFNLEYIPLLEHFFEENPFPTHADKMFLAKKSHMQYRQIHVWFQNRRSRTKKEGKPLRKKPVYEKATKPLDKLCERMKGHIVEPVSKSYKAGSSERAVKMQNARNNASKDTFVSSPPPHAFPSSYPPSCPYVPFPYKSGPVHFSKPEWSRVSCAKLPLPLSTSIDELVERFSRLNVRDEPFKASAKLQSHAATAAITVIPSRAPHPSLIVGKHLPPTNVIHHHPLVRAPVSSSRYFHSAGAASKPITLVSLSISPNKSELPGKRKTVPLPRYFPGRVRNVCRDTTPSDGTSTSSASPRLFSPSSEGRSSSFSNVGSISTSPDVASIQELPRSFGLPCRSPYDSTNNLGDMMAITPSSVS